MKHAFLAPFFFSAGSLIAAINVTTSFKGESSFSDWALGGTGSPLDANGALSVEMNTSWQLFGESGDSGAVGFSLWSADISLASGASDALIAEIVMEEDFSSLRYDVGDISGNFVISGTLEASSLQLAGIDVAANSGLDFKVLLVNLSGRDRFFIDPRSGTSLILATNSVASFKYDRATGTYGSTSATSNSMPPVSADFDFLRDGASPTESFDFRKYF